jgi:predicted DNA-binding helix-hairpin-helix protein
MDQAVAVARTLRIAHGFAGYIHLKAMPGVSSGLLQEAGRWADRLSVNIELPTPVDLRRLAPDKTHEVIERAMSEIKSEIDASDEERAQAKSPGYAAAGQTTQMIVGATPANDAEILGKAETLYRRYDLRRVYYSAYSPIDGQESVLEGTPTALVREHRLYQADHLLRDYGFSLPEIAPAPFLDLDIDPKLAWALREPGRWPVDVNVASREELLRVPGFGRRTVGRILRARRQARLRLADLTRMGARMNVARHFIRVPDGLPTTAVRRDAAFFAPAPQQLGLPI